MATRSSGKPKQASASRTSSPSVGRSRDKTAAGRRNPAAADPKPPEKSAGRSVARKAAGKTTRAAKKSAPSQSVGQSADKFQDQASTAIALLEEQNEALKAELAEARARIVELEEVNKNVAERIDWVIDSLQGVLAPKR